jgi:cell division septal protein FtsQ
MRYASMNNLLEEMKEWIITWLHLLVGAVLIGVIVYIVVVYLYPMAMLAGIAIGRGLSH